MIPACIDKSKLPHKPGVYLFKDSKGEIIYVGKAVDLYHRVASYFTGSHDNPKTVALVERIVSCETIEVFSELEALILEANLIKKYLPQYNIRLTDDKDYLYVKITNDTFPSIVTARKNELGDAKEYFGPFPSSLAVRSTLKKLRRIFPWCAHPPERDLSDSPQEVKRLKLRPCFYYHLGFCPGPCIGKISKKEYTKIINRFSKFMQGKKEELLQNLNEEMGDYAKNLMFEQAQAVKRIINGIEYISQSQNASVYLENPNFVESQNKLSLEELQKSLNASRYLERIECYDISNIQGQFAVGSLVVLTNGDIDKKWYRRFKIKIDGKPNDVAMMREVLQRRVKHKEWPTPDLVLIDGGKGQVRAAYEEIIAAGWKVLVLGLAKRMEWLYTKDNEVIKLPKSSLALRLLQKIRDEAHRFAVNYHRKLREESYRLSIKI